MSVVAASVVAISYGSRSIESSTYASGGWINAPGNQGATKSELLHKLIILLYVLIASQPPE